MSTNLSLKFLLPVVAIVLGATACAMPVEGEREVASTAQAMTVNGIAEYARRCDDVARELQTQQLVKPAFTLDYFQKTSWTMQDQMFASHASRCASFSSRVGVAGTQKTSFAAKLGGFGEEYETMAADMQMESKKFLTLSNASKARQDVAIAVIDNMK